MAKGAFLTNAIKMRIAQMHDEHPDWGPTRIREELLRVVREQALPFDKNWPSASAVGKVLRDIRDRERKLGPDPRDDPWTLQSMVKYPIPPEALPSVLQVWFFMQEWAILTIRQAQWVARLYAATKDIETLCGLSRTMANKERLLDGAGIGPIHPQMDNLYVFRAMTGHVITREEEKRLYGWSDEQWRKVEEMCAEASDELPSIEELWPEVRDELLIMQPSLRSGIRRQEIECSQKEAKNERINKTKRQK